jgi:hypothetical protein
MVKMAFSPALSTIQDPPRRKVGELRLITSATWYSNERPETNGNLAIDAQVYWETSKS